MKERPIIFILIATFAFAWMNICAKFLMGFHPMQVVFFRTFGSFIFIMPAIVLMKIDPIGQRPGLMIIRGVVGLISLATFFFAVQRIPVASAISIRYIGPIFGAVLALFFLKEPISRGQYISFIVAFSGVIVLKGLDTRIDTLSFVLVVISAFFAGGVFVFIRYLAQREHYLVIINYFMVVALVGSLLFIPFWRMPIGAEWWAVVGIGISGLFGQIFMTLAFKMAEASVLAPFKYMELVFALPMGLIFFGEGYTFFSFLGILLIIAGMILNVWMKNRKNAKLKLA